MSRPRIRTGCESFVSVGGYSALVNEIQMTKQQKAKAPILLTEAELDHVAGGDILNEDPFNQIAQMLGLPWWVSAMNDGNARVVFRNRSWL